MLWIFLEDGDEIELRFKFDTIFKKHVLEFVNWDSTATISIRLFKAIVCLFFCYLGVNIQ